MNVSLTGLEMPWLDDEKKVTSKGYRKLYSHGHSHGIRNRDPSLKAPILISDCMDETRSQVNGHHFTSKSNYRKHLKANGMIEMGNEKHERKAPESAITEADVAEAYEMCEQGAGAVAPESGPDGESAASWANLADSQGD